MKQTLPEIQFYVSYAPDNKYIGPTILPACEKSKALQRLMNRHIETRDFHEIHKMGFAVVQLDGDVRRLSKQLDNKAIKYEIDKNTHQMKIME